MTANAPGDLVLLSSDQAVVDVVLSAAAAMGRRPLLLTDPVALAEVWAEAGTVILGGDQAATAAGLGLARRRGIYLVGFDSQELGSWSLPLGAEVVLLPAGAAWLATILAGADGVGAPVVSVIGGSGGVGASTLATALAYRASRRGMRTVLVDVDAAGGGIDLLLGAEGIPGWRWPRLSGASGQLGSLVGHLPSVDGLDVLSMARGGGTDPSREPLAAVLSSLSRSHELVLVDPGRTWSPGPREALRRSSSVVLVAGQDLRGVAAARQSLRLFELTKPLLAVRAAVRPGLLRDQVADAVGLEVAVVLPHDAGLPAAADDGDPPGRRAGRPYSKACDQLLDLLLAGRNHG